jgi:hypothetical protein
MRIVGLRLGGGEVKDRGGLLCVLGDVNEHRAGAAGFRNLEGVSDGGSDVFGAIDEEIVFRDRQASEPSTLLETWPVMQTMGMESSMAVAMPVTRFVAPGPLVAKATPTFPEARA